MKPFVTFLMLLVIADVIYIYFTCQDFNSLYVSSVLILGGMTLHQIEKLEKEKASG